MDQFSIVTGCTPDYLPKLKWSLPTWCQKPQFAGKKLIVFHHGFDDAEKAFGWIRKYFKDLQLVRWTMKECANQRELMLSSFVLGVNHVQTPYYVKIDADTYFTDRRDVFDADDFKYSVVSHRWGYTKPGWWVNKLDGKPYDEKCKDRHHQPRIQSICCLHNTEFVRKIAQQWPDRLPVPSHDTVVWWCADRWSGYSWLGKNLGKYGVGHCSFFRKMKDGICAGDCNRSAMMDKLLMSHVQLEVTTYCQLKCHNCDRACGVAPSDEHMSLPQIWKFVEESLEAGHKWSRIDVIGGEPTYYPDLNSLFNFIKIYRDKFPKCRVRFSTNGLGEKAKAVLANEIPPWVCVRNSAKTTREQPHDAYNSAPCDNGEKVARFCSVPWRCGVAVTRYGWFLCNPGASIARVFGLDIGIKHFRDVTAEALLAQKDQLCKYCGQSYVPSRHTTLKQETSESWRKAIETYKNHSLELY